MSSSRKQVFGEFELIHKIADGGMGEIFLAADKRLARPVAIKRVLEKFRSRPDVVRMFEVEAAVMTVLRHESIVRIFESGDIDNVFYFSMEYIHGKTLRQIVDRCREMGESLPAGLAVEIILKLGQALAHAHGIQGRSGRPMSLVHRDVNPSNLLVGYDGSVKLIDFGIVQTDDELAPEDLEAPGKTAYMSPEQARGGRVDQRSDLFALGICFYEALTLYNPFIHDASGMSPSDAIFLLHPAPLVQRNHRLAVLDPLLSRLLEKEPAFRFDDAQEFVGDLIALSNASKIRAPISLARFMSDLFEDQKKEEDAILASAKLGSESKVVVSGSHAPKPPPTPVRRKRLSASEKRTSRRPPIFFAASVVVIVVSSVFASMLVYRDVMRRRVRSQELGRTESTVRVADPRQKSLARLRVVSEPPVAVFHDGEQVPDQNLFDLFEANGVVQIGQGRDVVFDPIGVTLQYELVADQVVLRMTSQPTGQIRGPGGATFASPAVFRLSPGFTSFDLQSADHERNLRLVLYFRKPVRG